MPPRSEYRKRSVHYNAYQKAWAKKNKTRLNAKARAKHRANREIAIALYGGKCACPGGCGKTTYEWLAIDHIEGGGTKERKAKFPNAQSFYVYLKTHYEPDKYRVLCHDCNSARGYYGYCPHERGVT